MTHNPVAVTTTNQAADLLEQYAGFIRSDVKADDLERHPYLPLIEQVVADLRSGTPPPTCVLCAGKCRGHGLADPVAWEPEVGSVAATHGKKANAQARANAVAGARQLGATDSITLKLREVLRTELERQCAIGAGTFTVDDGFAQSGLWQVNADLDSGSLIAALARAQKSRPHDTQGNPGGKDEVHV
jgi:hypothetical protein